MIKRALQQLQRSYMQEINEMYELFDTRGKGTEIYQQGYIDASALVQGMKSLGYEIEKGQINQMINYLDRQGERKGVITKQNFKKFMSSKLDINNRQSQIKAAFEFYDQDNRGKITLSDLKRVAEELGQNVEECEGIMKQVDKNGDGFLSYEEFVRVIKKTSYN